MTLTSLDLAQCANEPIRVPGAIQPHGWLVSFDGADGALVACSSNCHALLGEPAGPLAPAAQRRLTQGLAELLARTPRLEDRPVSLGTLPWQGRVLHALAHEHAGLRHVELEAAEPALGPQAPIYGLTRHMVPAMQQVDGVVALCRIAAEQVRRITGFGRSLVYRFDADGHGEVLAEEAEPGYDRYANHRFPASDIPAQARELYRLNHFRLIPDARYQPVPLQFTDPRWAGAAFDMSWVGLRSVSPVHLEYMRNMGTLASMSVSIMVRGQLWGLISCHDHAPRHLHYAQRMACEHVGQLLSLQIEAKEDHARVHEQAMLGQLTLGMVARLADSDATLQMLVHDPAPLLRIAQATGAAVVLNDRCWTTGDTPAEAELLTLADWLATRVEPVFHTDELGAACPALAPLADRAAGLLAISISQVHRHHVMWFRPERVQTIDWAGQPTKVADLGDGRLHPRRSFATWREQVRGRSLPWSPAQVGAVQELRQALLAIVLRRAEELASVAGELGRVNRELEAFSYTVSHDLRAPMRQISGYVDLVMGDDAAALTARSRRYLVHARDAAAFAGLLVDALLDFSRMGRAALRQAAVHTDTLVHDLVRDIEREEATQQPGRRIEWHIEPDLPRLWADPVLLQVAVRNLLHNAVKYSRSRDPARIEVSARRGPEGEGLQVRDNGVGFQMKYADKLFGVFQRLHHSEDYEGTGIGLATVRRIVERHGGQVTAHGEPGAGATFGFTLPPLSSAAGPSA